jgi:hypothetical protein
MPARQTENAPRVVLYDPDAPTRPFYSASPDDATADFTPRRHNVGAGLRKTHRSPGRTTGSGHAQGQLSRR